MAGWAPGPTHARSAASHAASPEAPPTASLCSSAAQQGAYRCGSVSGGGSPLVASIAGSQRTRRAESAVTTCRIVRDGVERGAGVGGTGVGGTGVGGTGVGAGVMRAHAAPPYPAAHSPQPVPAQPSRHAQTQAGKVPVAVAVPLAWHTVGTHGGGSNVAVATSNGVFDCDRVGASIVLTVFGGLAVIVCGAVGL